MRVNTEGDRCKQQQHSYTRISRNAWNCILSSRECPTKNFCSFTFGFQLMRVARADYHAGLRATSLATDIERHRETLTRMYTDGGRRLGDSKTCV